MKLTSFSVHSLSFVAIFLLSPSVLLASVQVAESEEVSVLPTAFVLALVSLAVICFRRPATLRRIK